MSTTTKPVFKPTSTKSDIETDLQLGEVSSAKQAFMVAAMNMSWQLAVVVLIPIVGGFKLDEHFNTTPLWIIVGFVVAVLGMAAVVWRQLQIFSPSIPADKPTPKGRK